MITIQVLPFAAGAHRALSGSFVILEFSEGSGSPLVYNEGLTGGSFRNKTEEVRSYWTSFESVRSAAYDHERSLAFITSLADGRA